VTRVFLITVAALVCALPPLVWGAYQATREVYNSPPEWVPASFEQRRDYIRFVDQFEADDSIVVSWDGCTVDDERLGSLERLLRDAPDPERRETYDRLYDRVLSGYGVVREMTDGALGISRREALARLRGSLVGPDGRTSCAIVVPTLYAAYHREEAIGRLVAAAAEVTGLPPEELYLAGPIVDGYVIDIESMRSLRYFAVPSAILALLLCWLCLGSWRLTLVIVAAAMIGQLLVLALTYYLGYTMNAVLIILPALVFVLTVSAGVHLANYYFDQIRMGAGADSPRRALLAGWVPCTLAAVTTAIGVASLMVSDIEPIRVFSFVAVIGILAAVSLLFLMLPGAMQLWLPRRKSLFGALGRSEGSATSAGWRDGLAGIVCKRPGWISLLCLGLMVICALGVPQIQTSVNIRGLFVPDSRIIRDYQWFEEHLGPLVPVEVVVRFDEDNPLDVLERLELVQRVHVEMARLESVGGVMSAATFMPSIPAPGGMRGVVARTRYRRGLDDHLPHLRKIDYLHSSDTEQAWRISARAPALSQIDYGHFLDELREHVEPILDAQPEPVETTVSATYTGVMSLVDEAQRALLHDLFTSFLTAFGVVALVMMLVLRSVWAGAIVMLPNIFPAVVLFGLMGWLAWPVDIGSVMTASVALGIAVDGTLHFLTWYRRESQAGASPFSAVARCYQHCGTALMQATVICGLGLLVYAFSDFVPTRQFAWMMLLLLLAALVGDLILLPTLLVGPVGRRHLVAVRGSPQEEPPRATPALEADEARNYPGKN